MKLKICGMKSNTAEVSELQPDYLGFIFYDKGPRYCEGQRDFEKEIAFIVLN